MYSLPVATSTFTVESRVLLFINLWKEFYSSMDWWLAPFLDHNFAKRTHHLSKNNFWKVFSFSDSIFIICFYIYFCFCFSFYFNSCFYSYSCFYFKLSWMLSPFPQLQWKEMKEMLSHLDKNERNSDWVFYLYNQFLIKHILISNWRGEDRFVDFSLGLCSYIFLWPAMFQWQLQ